jgi:hypothetical protein
VGPSGGHPDDLVAADHFDDRGEQLLPEDVDENLTDLLFGAPDEQKG